MTVQGALTECGSSGCLDQNVTSRLEPRFDDACGPDKPCIGDWTDLNCGQDPCPQLPPSQGWQALLDMLSSPYTPNHVPNPNLLQQANLPKGVTDIAYQPTLP